MNNKIKKGYLEAITSEPKTIKKEKMPEIRIASKAKLIITEEINNKIKFICKKINNVEWSAALFYEVSGDITDPENMVCTVKDLYLMDIGSSAHTQFNYDGLAPAYNDHEEWIDNEYRLGLIHSHQAMSVFYSGEDMSELSDNVDRYEFYLSIVVNNANDIIGRIGYLGKQISIESIQNNFVFKGQQYVFPEVETKKEIDVLFYIDCEVEKPVEQVPPIYSEIIERIESLKKPPVNTKTEFTSTYNSRYFDNDYDYYSYNKSDKYDPTEHTSVEKPLYNKSTIYHIEMFLKNILITGFSKYGVKSDFESLDVKLKELEKSKITDLEITDIITGGYGIKPEDSLAGRIFQNMGLSYITFEEMLYSSHEYLEDKYSEYKNVQAIPLYIAEVLFDMCMNFLED